MTYPYWTPLPQASWLHPPQSPSEGLSDRASPSNLCCLACSGWHLLWDCPHSPVPTGTCNLTSHVPVTPQLLLPCCLRSPHAWVCLSSPSLWASWVPAFHGDTGENECDQDIRIIGYDPPTKPTTKVLLLKNPPLLATLQPQVSRDMMCKGTVHFLCLKGVLQKQSFPK